ncbi:hypothetical protein WA158_001242 [Blastocystis sp. Blastoise]
MNKKILSKMVLTKGEDMSMSEVIHNKYYGLYFSAHWCGPCKKFTPLLKKRYNKMKKISDDFEVIFCSLDKNQKEFDEYYEMMPWKAFPFESKTGEDLSKSYRVEFLPTLILFNPQGEIISQNAVKEFEDMNHKFPWESQNSKEV